MSRVPSLEQIFDRHLRLLSTTLRPGTLNHYRFVARHFLAYLRATFPDLGRLSQLRRDPHVVGWCRCLCEHHPPLCNATRPITCCVSAVCCRTWLRTAPLSRSTSFVPRTFLPPPTIYPDLSPLPRIKACSRNCVGLIIRRPTRCCSPAPPGCASANAPMRSTLAKAAQRAGCSGRVVPHRLRHSFATEMLRLGVSLKALMQLLGHKDIRMTLRYVQVTQQDLQREFHQARQRAAQPPPIPELSLPRHITHADLAGIRQALAATRHLLEMYCRQLGDTQAQRKLRRLDRRLLAVASQLERIA
jgi:hypothetical protein